MRPRCCYSPSVLQCLQGMLALFTFGDWLPLPVTASSTPALVAFPFPSETRACRDFLLF